MARFDFEGLPMHYESHGAGAPILLLNGIFMSCASWKWFVPSFSAQNQLLLLDLADQGISGKVDHEYTLEMQERAVIALLDHLGLAKTNICGFSYGGEIAMRLAARYPQRIGKLVLSNTTANTGFWLASVGHSWEAALSSHDGRQFFAACIPSAYSPGFFTKHEKWARMQEDMYERLLTPQVCDAYARLTRSAEFHDERANLKNIKAETLVISSQWDFITPLPCQQEIVQAIAAATHVIIPDAGHTVVYEKPTEFASLVLGFVNNDSAGIDID